VQTVVKREVETNATFVCKMLEVQNFQELVTFKGPFSTGFSTVLVENYDESVTHERRLSEKCVVTAREQRHALLPPVKRDF
jgi:hypothetical protein